MTRTPATPQELLARRNAVLAFIAAHVGKTLPPSREIAAAIGCTTAQVGHSFTALVRDGSLSSAGSGGSRVFIVTGVGATIARHPGKEVAAYTDRAPEPQPVRVFNYSCHRCGAKNCLRHGEMPITTRPLPAFMRAA